MIGLIAAFHKPNSGKVLVDGIDLATVRLDSYRTQLGMVLQDSFLFDGTIRENVAFSKPDATEQEILRACAIARVDEFAEGYEQKYDTIIGERGVKLSGVNGSGFRLRARDPGQPSHPDPRRGDIESGLGVGGADPERPVVPDAGAHHFCNRPSPLNHSACRSDSCGGSGTDCGTRTHQSLFELGGRYFDLYTKQHGIEQNLFLAPGEGDVPEEVRGNGGVAAENDNSEVLDREPV